MTSRDSQVLDGVAHNDKDRTVNSRNIYIYMAFKVGSLKICGFISALSGLCSRNQSQHFEYSLKAPPQRVLYRD